jgi:cytidyltransferase-like protein
MTPRDKKIGIFLGRLQPQHPGHEFLIDKIFRENDEVVLCIGSAQKIPKENPHCARNPLSTPARKKRLESFLTRSHFSKPYRIVTARDIEPDSAWPIYLKKRCGLSERTRNTIYFADAIDANYAAGLTAAGFLIKTIKRKHFLYTTKKDETHRISSATEVRSLEEMDKGARPS